MKQRTLARYSKVTGTENVYSIQMAYEWLDLEQTRAEAEGRLDLPWAPKKSIEETMEILKSLGVNVGC